MTDDITLFIPVELAREWHASVGVQIQFYTKYVKLREEYTEKIEKAMEESKGQHYGNSDSEEEGFECSGEKSTDDSDESPPRTCGANTTQAQERPRRKCTVGKYKEANIFQITHSATANRVSVPLPLQGLKCYDNGAEFIYILTMFNMCKRFMKTLIQRDFERKLFNDELRVKDLEELENEYDGKKAVILQDIEDAAQIMFEELRKNPENEYDITITEKGIGTTLNFYNPSANYYERIVHLQQLLLKKYIEGAKIPPPADSEHVRRSPDKRQRMI